MLHLFVNQVTDDIKYEKAKYHGKLIKSQKMNLNA